MVRSAVSEPHENRAQGLMTQPLDIPKQTRISQNSPEINELDIDKNILKTWEHNFENQKS